MNGNTGIIFILGAFSVWQFYKHRKSIWHNMNLYAKYYADYLKCKEDERKKKNER